MAVFQSNTLTIVDQTDNRKFEIYIKSNMPTVQVRNANTGAYSPDWSSGLELTADVYLDSREMESYSNVSFKWSVDDGSSVTQVSTSRTYRVTSNVLASKPILTYICVASYQNVTATSKITFTRTDTGLNGTNGTPAPAVQAQYSADGSTGWTATLNTATHKYIRYSYDGGNTWSPAIKMVGEDGTSVNIKGTATSKTTVSGTSYFTLVHNETTITGAALGDAYLLEGNMYVCVDSRDGNDYFMDVGRIQGPQGKDGQSSYVFIRYATDANGANMSSSPSSTTTHIGICTVNTNVAPTTASSYTWSKFVGDNAKSIVLTGSAQVFKVSKTNSYTPSTISVTATPINTTVTDWSYSVNGGQTFLSTVPTGVVRNGNVVTVTGSTFASNSLVIKASNGTISDVFTIYKAFDGTDGTPGNPGAPASMAFLTNENISFSASSNGTIPLTSASTFTANIVSYNGTTKTTPTISAIGNLPSGMTVIPNKGTAYSSVTPTIGNLTVADLYTSNTHTTKVDKTKLINGDSFVVGNYLYIYNLASSNFKCQTIVNTDGVEQPSTFVVNNEIMLTFSIAKDATLGSNSSNNGNITIPVVAPVSTNLKLSWSKINTGATGVGISSTTVTYGVSDSSSTQPTEWKSEIPEVEDGKYLWTRTVIDYTDPARADTVTYTYAKQGTIGETGNPGTSVTVSSVQYQSGTSATTAPNGTWSSAVVSVADGNYLWTKTTFSDGKIAYGVAKQGSAGTPASLVNITPSALYFKSTTGANGTFTPQYIYLYPRFQSATYSNWQYSRDGGATWTSATGANGLTIGTYNSVANSLRVDRASTLYTNDITSISFKCNSTNASVYDTVSIAKLYDVVDLQIGGANLLRGTKDFIIDTNRINGWRNTSSYIIATDEDGFAVVNKTSTTETTNVHYGIYSSVVRAAMGDKFTVSFWMKVKNVSLWDNQVPIILELYNDALGRVAWRDCQISYLSTTPSTIQNDVWTYCTLDFELNSSTFSFTTNSTWSDVKFFGIRFSLAKNGDVYFKKAKLEIGNKATDWSPAPEDLLNDAANVNVMLSNESHFFEATAGGIPTDTSVILDVVGYKGSIQSATTVGVISGLPSAGMTATISSNNTTSTKITISVTSALTSSVADYGTLTIPITVNGHTINKKFNWVKAKAGDTGQPGGDAVTFQVYSNNGYALSINTPTITLQTFAYVGDIKIQSGATYQWYRYGNTDWIAISGATNSYFTVSRDDVAFSNSYMCKMQFNNAEYVGVATIDDKNDSNKVFTTKPSNYAVGDLWIVGVDYVPTGVEVGTLLKAEHTNTTYEDADWVTSLKYDDKIAELENDMKTYNQYFSFDSTDGLKISAKDNNGTPSQFSTSLTNERLSFNYGNEAIAYINGTKMNIKEAEIESPLTVTGKYSGSTMLQAPVINIGNFSIIVESNGSLSIVANT